MQRGIVFDPRVDKVLSWVMGFAATAALTIGALFYKGTQETMLELRKDVGEVKLEIAELRATKREIQDMKEAILREASEAHAQILRMDDRLLKLERQR